VKKLITLNVLTTAWVGCWCTGFILTHVPIEPGGAIRIPHLDKVGHVALFFFITYLGGVRLHVRSGRGSVGAWIAWAMIYLCYGVFDEVTQSLTGRDADLNDWLFDVLGVALATLLLWKRLIPPWFQAPASAAAG